MRERKRGWMNEQTNQHTNKINGPIRKRKADRQTEQRIGSVHARRQARNRERVKYRRKETVDHNLNI